MSQVLELNLPTDAELDLLSPPAGKALTMYEKLVYSGRMERPKCYERANMDHKMFLTLCSPRTIHDLQIFLRYKASRSKRRLAEASWDHGDDT